MKKFDRKKWLKVYMKKNWQKFRHMCLLSWDGFIPLVTQCEMCGRDIYFHGGLGKRNAEKNSIHFDHRLGGLETIKGSPYTWLLSHVRCKENEKVWKQCNFGMVCQDCNLRLPTKNRGQYLINLINYMNKTKQQKEEIEQ